MHLPDITLEHGTSILGSPPDSRTSTALPLTLRARKDVRCVQLEHCDTCCMLMPNEAVALASYAFALAIHH
jgi:hypothetical protein